MKTQPPNRFVYLASPYSHPEAAVRQARFEAACRAAAELIRRGDVVFSPIAHSHAIAQHGLPMDWGFWEAQDRRLLAACDELWVLKLDGWQHSRGVQAEIAIVRALGKPVRFVSEAELTEEKAAGMAACRGGDARCVYARIERS